MAAKIDQFMGVSLLRAEDGHKRRREPFLHTTTKEGSAVIAIKDSNTYPTGIEVSDDELAALNLYREPFHGEWNYTINSQER